MPRVYVYKPALLLTKIQKCSKLTNSINVQVIVLHVKSAIYGWGVLCSVYDLRVLLYTDCPRFFKVREHNLQTKVTEKHYVKFDDNALCCYELILYLLSSMTNLYLS